jgi:aspartyl-tRNA(Asn)/glutamyl-tRNA(Gln) amidotransferase subunit A
MSNPTGSAVEIREQVQGREVRAEEVVRGCLERIERVDPLVGAFLSTCGDAAIEEARQVDRRLDAGEHLPLAGVPVAVKDLICTRGIPTTCGSRILESFRPPYDATSVRRLRDAGAVVVGKTSMDEFGMGSSNENSAYGPVRNPWDLGRVPGGSSGGSAAAVAARMTPVSLGTDTGGSVRQPAALCGVVGLKPSYGRVSRYGLIAFASSLDQVGPMGGNVRDCAALLQVLAGADPRDATSSQVAVADYEASLDRGLAGLRVGVPREYFSDGVDAEVDAAVQGALDVMAGQGARLQPISLPHTGWAIPAYYLVANAEASSNLARYDGVRYGERRGGDGSLSSLYRKSRGDGFGPEVKRRIMLGTFALSAGYHDAYYRKAMKVRRLIGADFEAAFREVDLVACPTTPEPAFRLGEKLDDPLAMYLSDVFTVTANLAGLPALSLPCGLSGDGLPIGLQLMAPPFQEERLLATAHALEDELGFEARRPELPRVGS